MTRRRALLAIIRLWWVWAALGVTVIVLSAVNGHATAAQGSPFVAGCLLLVIGVTIRFKIAQRRRGGPPSD